MRIDETAPHTQPRELTIEDARGRTLALVTLEPLSDEPDAREVRGFSLDEANVVRVETLTHQVHVFDATSGETRFRGQCE